MSQKNRVEQVGRLFEQLIDGLEAAERPTPLRGAEAKAAEQVVKGIVDPILCGAGFGLMQLNQYRWFARELSRLLRQDEARILAMHLPILLVKWQGFGLDKNTLQLLVCEVMEGLHKLQEVERTRLVPGTVPCGNPAEVRSQNAECRSQNGGTAGGPDG